MNAALFETLEDNDAVFPVIDEKVRRAAPAELVLVVVKEVLEVLVGKPVGTGRKGWGAGVVQRHKPGLEVGEGERLKIRLKLRRAESTTDKGNWHGYLQDEVCGGLSTVSRVG